jgi:hypothetical protein
VPAFTVKRSQEPGYMKMFVKEGHPNV